ncbi:ParB/RepB/Spo0J family partition protein [Pelagibius litoralis]|uniref:ParB/RepB/Spo0J family partition protein n=1 Tax=Pelagibius litoralis TaxID=374515 RepID=A0A967F2G0_9PROT|nr:ParB/RepB/Spo0J family partition protein [Pelagibius litoralis]NIA71691.1 ParB/RepB/Spo0J family partition protein [Pelagibius litoralis]
MTDGASSDQGKRNNLGRGLAALFGEENEDYASLDKVRANKSVPVEHLHPGRYQPRQHFDEEAVSALAESVKAQGILQPILVRRHPERPSEFEIVAGERRWRAAQRAKLHEVPVIIRDLTDAESLELAIVENVQRQDLTPIEEAEGYRRLLEEFQHTQDDLAKVVGKSRSHVANTMRLLSLPEAVKAMVMEGKLSAGHARTLVGCESPEDLAAEIVSKGLNVRQAERLVQEAKAGARSKTRTGSSASPGEVAKDSDTIALERDLTALLGLKVSIKFHGDGGSLTIHYKTLEQLDDVLHRLNQMPPMAGRP